MRCWLKPTALAERLVGGGLLAAEGDVHRRQRRIMSLPFTQAYVNAYFHIFLSAGQKLSSKWQGILDKQAENANDVDKDVIELTAWLGRSALDIIGLTAFDTDLGAMSQDNNELASTFRAMMSREKDKGPKILLIVLRTFFPILKRFKTDHDLQAEKSKKTMQETCDRMIAERVQSIKSGQAESRKDLLSLLGMHRLPVLSKNSA